MDTYFASHIMRNGTEIRAQIPGTYRTLALARAAIPAHWDAIKANIEHQILVSKIDAAFKA